MKTKLLRTLLALCLSLSLLTSSAGAADVLYSGSCGEHASWVLTDDGVMTISGTGTVTAPMTKEERSQRSWLIHTLVVEEGISEIGEEAFAYYDINKIHLPESLTTIGNGAFGNNSSLLEVTFGSGLRSIGHGAFFCCRHLKAVDLPTGLTEIGPAAFVSCSALETLVVPGSVKTIGASAFAQCDALKSVFLLDGVETLGDGAFQSCWQVTDFYLPDTIRSFGNNCFRSCCSIKLFRIPDGVEEIPAGCFAECGSLSTVILPDSVKAIDRDAFKDSSNLLALFYAGTEDGLMQIRIDPMGNEPLAYASTYIIPGMPDPAFGCFDMPARDNWAYDGIAFCLATGLMNGMGNGYFQPNGTTTRAQLVTILWRMMDEPEASKPAPFTDLTQDWYREAVAWAAENGITTGTSATTFDPNAPVTREQMVTIFYRMCRDYLKIDVSPSASLAPFPDNAKVSPWAKDALQWGVAVKLINGVGDSGGNVTLQPQGSATRAQIATVMLNFVTAFHDE